eukprot:TRINITY_DN29607_c0_g1_i1.p4 TRINITY_DN29607_c0_g1~~TRINITY_DN29607_c0_g1_i1.p4  ORF type:complete len:118 (+),score=6.60 TRINITY_DN29607_c0_g1_i1:1529-1882(+)
MVPEHQEPTLPEVMAGERLIAMFPLQMNLWAIVGKRLIAMFPLHMTLRAIAGKRLNVTFPKFLETIPLGVMAGKRLNVMFPENLHTSWPVAVALDERYFFLGSNMTLQLPLSPPNQI